ncbi:MAG: O-antigen ligase family protein [Candidatus Moranbacteria bacterium]|nr:O-antigen ligase family protein [Candidatus Moranbacteria bacterium]
MNRETVSAIFVIVAVSLFIFSNFAFGFSLPLYLVLMLTSFAIVVAHPRSGLYAIVFLTFIFERFFTLAPIVLSRSELKLYPVDVLFLAVIVGIVVNLMFVHLDGSRIVLKKIFSFKSERLLLLFIALVSIYFLSSFFDPNSDKDLAFSAWKNYGFYALLYFAVIILLNKKEHLVRFLKFALAGAIGIIFFIIYGIISGQGLWSEFTPLSTEGVRLLAFPHAFYLTMSVLTLGVFLVFSPVKKYRKYFWLLPIWIFGIIGSMMRHLWIGLILSAFVAIVFLPKEKGLFLKSYVGKIIFGAATVIVFVFYLSAVIPHSKIEQGIDYSVEVLGERTASFSSFSEDESFFWRGMLWLEAGEKIKENPLVGIGLGKRLSLELGDYQDLVEVRNVHNSLLAILLQGGLLLLLPLAGFVFLILRDLFGRKEKDWIVIALIALAVNYLIVFLFQPYLETNLLGIFFWIIFGLARVSKDIFSEN